MNKVVLTYPSFFALKSDTFKFFENDLATKIFKSPRKSKEGEYIYHIYLMCRCDNFRCQAKLGEVRKINSSEKYLYEDIKLLLDKAEDNKRIFKYIFAQLFEDEDPPL